jgi:hypothetical protein
MWTPLILAACAVCAASVLSFCCRAQAQISRPSERCWHIRQAQRRAEYQLQLLTKQALQRMLDEARPHGRP